MQAIYSGNALYAAFRRAQKSSPWKGTTQVFEMDFLHQLATLQNELKTRTYKTATKSSFVLSERGKTRLIHGSRIRDRVVRHAFCDNVLQPLLQQKLIYDNGASVPGKGIRFSRERFKVHLQKYYRHHGNKGYILLMDYSGFYDNLRHDLLYQAVTKHLKDEYAQWLLKLVLNDFRQDVSFLTDDEIKKLYDGKYKALDFKDVPKHLKTGQKWLAKSVDIGDQCSQILGIYFPTRIDNYIKIVCGEKYYGRYMDDSYIISPSKAHLIDLLAKIKHQASQLGIILNDKKVRIVKLSQTFRFLQNKYFLTESGKVVERINPKRIVTLKRKLKKLKRKFQQKIVSFEDIELMYKSWFGAHQKVMSRIQKQNLNTLFKQLFFKGENK